MEFDNIFKDKINKTKYTFTNDQQKAINTIIDFIAKPFNPANFIIGLTGAGGTGKTFITNYIIDHCKYSNSLIKCTSSTHKACRIFSQAINNKTVDTIQSTFGLRLDLKLEDFNPNNPQFNPMSKPKLDNIKLLFIDEASMIPASLITYIARICKNSEIKIVFIGDASQLAPVNENKSIAFNICSEVCTLKEIVRQDTTNPITNILELLRHDIFHKSFMFLNYISTHINTSNYNEINEGYYICNKQQFINKINASFTNKEYTKNIDMFRIIGYTNNCVSNWNYYIRNLIIDDANKNIITKNDLIMSYETIVDDFMYPIINNSEEYIVNDIIDFIDNIYEFKGFIIKFQQIHGGFITKPLFVIDHRDKFTIMKYYDTITKLINAAKTSTGGTRVKRWKEYYDFKKKYLIAANIKDKNNKILFNRDLDYGFAITSHKSQGSTYDTVFVDLNDMVYKSTGELYNNVDDLLRRIYVACSRAKKELILCYGS